MVAMYSLLGDVYIFRLEKPDASCNLQLYHLHIYNTWYCAAEAASAHLHRPRIVAAREAHAVIPQMILPETGERIAAKGR